MTNRRLQPQVDPEAAGLFVNLLARYANNSPNKTDMDRRIEAALGNDPTSRAVVSRMVTRFQAEPLEQRRATFGPWAELNLQSVSQEHMQTVFRRLKPIDLQSVYAVGSLNDEAGNTEPDSNGMQPIRMPAATARPITISYTGLYCQKETVWDRGTSEDEIYIVTSVSHMQGNQRVTRTTRHPMTSPGYYTELDTGEVRDGPIETCWSGAAQELTVATWVLEQDDGNPQAYKDQIDKAVRAALEVAEDLGAGGIVKAMEKAASLITIAITWLIGGADDLIDESIRTFSSRELNSWVRTRPSDFKGIPYHFKTRHYGEGARYHVYYRLTS